MTIPNSTSSPKPCNKLAEKRIVYVFAIWMIVASFLRRIVSKFDLRHRTEFILLVVAGLTEKRSDICAVLWKSISNRITNNSDKCIHISFDSNTSTVVLNSVNTRKKYSRSF